MFSLAKSKKMVDIQPYIRRLCDLSAPNLYTAVELEGRCENRYDRAIPTLLGPWQDDHPLEDACVFGLTNNIADRGIGLILNQPFRASEVVIGYWLPSREVMCEPRFFLGTLQHNQPIGGGFWTVGVELTEYANPNQIESIEVLKPLAAKLRSPIDVATA